MNFEDIMLNERSKSQKNTNYMIAFTWNTQNRQSYGNRKHISGYLTPRGGKGGVRAEGHAVSFWGDEHTLKLTVVMAAHSCEYTKNIELYILDGLIIWYVNYIYQ